MDLKKKMLNYRAKENISQHELAKRCCVSYMTIRNAESGRLVTELTEAKIRRVVDEDNGI